MKLNSNYKNKTKLKSWKKESSWN